MKLFAKAAAPRSIDFNADSVVAIAKKAGAQIVRDGADRTTLEIQTKLDGSSVTSADLNADRFIKQRLSELTPGIPILSEEDALEHQQACMKKGTYWCIDPLDGTGNFINGNNYFGVLIGLVKDGVPVFGVAHYPAAPSGAITYSTNAQGTKAFRQRGEGDIEPIHVTRKPTLPLRSTSRAQDLVSIGKAPVEPSKFWGNSNLAIAEGALDVGYYPHREEHPPGYWDVAGPQAILRAAGGEIYDAPRDVEALNAANALRNLTPTCFTEQGPNGDRMPYMSSGLAASGPALQRMGTKVQRQRTA